MAALLLLLAGLRPVREPQPSLPPSRDMVRCPVPGCGCYPLRADRLARHLRRCPKLIEQSELESSGYWAAGANTGADEVDSNISLGGSHKIASRPVRDLDAIIRKAHTTTRDSLAHEPAVRTEQPAASGPTGKNAAERARHAAQRSSIVSLLASMDLLGRGHCIVELGAGNGELTRAMVDFDERAARSDSFILVDQHKPKGRKAAGRAAADSDLKARCLHFRRIKMKLEDIDLVGLREVIAPDREIVVVSKHLCGAASDYALRAVGRASVSGRPPLAVLLGTCCHHRCDWTSYPNRALLEMLGFGSSDFDQLCRMSSRGVDPNAATEAAHTGRLVKDLLDEGRAAFLRKHGYDATLHTYIQASVTPENVLLKAVSSRDGVKNLLDTTV